MSPDCTSSTLTDRQIEQFHRDRVLGPFDLLSETEAREMKARVRLESQRPGPHHDQNGFRHLDCPSVWDLCARDEIVERIAELLGPDLVLWRSQLFWKHAGDAEIPWHQDAANWPIEPGNTISAWIALDDATRSTGCIEMLPGQHSRLIDQHEAPGFGRFRHQLDLGQLDVGPSEHFEVRAGQFLIFDDHIPHRSGRNLTGHDRLAIAARVTRPEVPIDWQRLFADFRVLLLRGSHDRGVNPLGRPPIRPPQGPAA